jgi:hypothetical protein
MRLRQHVRAGVALASAYAIALQAILLALGAVAADAHGRALFPLCTGAIAGDSTPAGRGHGHHDHDKACFGACLTGCCAGAAIGAAPAATHAPARPRTMALATEVRAAALIRSLNAHRSRAPPRA